MGNSTKGTQFTSTDLMNPNWVEDVESGKDLRAYESGEATVAYTEEPLPQGRALAVN